MIKNFIQKHGWKNIALLGVTIIMTTIAIIMGIYAVQTVMKTRLKADILPAYKTEIFVVPESGSEVLIFKNFGTVTIAEDTSLSGNIFTLNDEFIKTYGQDFTLKIYNYNTTEVQVTITSSATTVTGATGIPAEITNPKQTIPAISGNTASFVNFAITNNPIVPQTLTIEVEFEIPSYTVTFNWDARFLRKMIYSGSYTFDKKITANSTGNDLVFEYVLTNNEADYDIEEVQHRAGISGAANCVFNATRVSENSFLITLTLASYSDISNDIVVNIDVGLGLA